MREVVVVAVVIGSEELQLSHEELKMEKIENNKLSISLDASKLENEALKVRNEESGARNRLYPMAFLLKRNLRLLNYGERYACICRSFFYGARREGI